ncbi:hypothetical protein BJF79_47940 [Actinomadura sp. CNU-125]|nr:hypothetical protein [Actinomadura sp. CNU-125]OLT19284.1 hypothetical protein BJF79_47940 [Actinomadura sp. CNU-125]
MQVLAGAERARVLDRDGAGAGVAQDAGQQAEGLCGAVGDDDVGGVGAHAAVAGEPGGDGRAQCGGAAGVAVAEAGGGQCRQDGAFGAQPCGAGEGGQVGQAG